MKTQYDYYKMLGISPAESIKLAPMVDPNIHRSGPFRIDDAHYTARSKEQEVQKLILQNRQLKRNCKKTKSLQQQNTQFRIKFNDIKSQHENLLTQNRDLQLQLRSALKKAALVEQRQKKFRSQVSFLKDSNAQLQSTLADLQYKFEQSKERSKKQSSILKSSNLQLRQLASQLQQLKQVNQKFKTQNKKLKQTIQDLERSCAQANSRFQDTTQQLNKMAKTVQSSKLQSQRRIGQQSHQLKSLSQKSRAMQTQKEQLQRAVTQLQQRIREMNYKTISMQRSSEQKDRIIQGLRNDKSSEGRLRDCLQQLTQVSQKLKVVSFQKIFMRTVARKLLGFVELTKEQHAEESNKVLQEINELKFKNEELKQQLQSNLIVLREAQQNLVRQKSRKITLMRLNAQLSEQNQAIKKRGHKLKTIQTEILSVTCVDSKIQRKIEDEHLKREKFSMSQKSRKMTSSQSQTDQIGIPDKDRRVEEQSKPLSKDQKSQLRRLRKVNSQLAEQLTHNQTKFKTQFQNEKGMMKMQFQNTIEQLKSQIQQLNKSLQLLRIDRPDHD